MQSNSKQIRSAIKKYQELEIIDSEKLYNSIFKNISKQSFYKELSRMSESNELERLSKGLYFVPKKSRFGLVSINEKNVVDYYVNKNKGVIVGYKMYNKYMLTTQISKNIDLFSNNIVQKNRNVLNIHIYKADIKFDDATKRMIELLNVLENYHEIEDLNYINLLKYIKKTIGYYDEKKVNKILKEIKIKKSTLASLRNVLDYYEVENNINDYLNELSKYKTIDMEKLSELTR